MQRVSAARNVCISATILLASATYIAFAWRDYSAFAHSKQAAVVEGLRAACSIQPENASYWRSLSAYEFFVNNNTDAAASFARKAAGLNPWEARNWLTLALAYQVSGDEKGQAEALDRAIDADPRTPAIAWDVANYFISRGENDKALPLLRRVIENDSELTNNAFLLSWRATHDVQRILENAIPPSPVSHVLFLRFLINRDEEEAAAVVWSRVVHLRQPVSTTYTNAYVDYLLNKKKSTKAREVWNQIAELNQTNRITDTGNLVVNGDFESSICASGFDWHCIHTAGVRARIDGFEKKSGTESLSIHFEGAPDNAGIFEYVPVQPGARYEFTAFVKAREITTGSGPRLGIFDAYTDRKYVLTDELLESTVWQEVSSDFVVGPDTNVVAFRIVREPSTPDIKGEMWLDDVRIVRK